MKDFLLLIVAGLVLVAIFADGGLELSPEISPAFDAALNVQYSPDRSTTTIEQQTNIDTNIEHQLVVVQPPPESSKGVRLVDVGPGRCPAQPGDIIEEEQGNGACVVVADGRRYFVNPSGGRWPLVDNSGLPGELVPLPAPTTEFPTSSAGYSFGILGTAAALQPPAAPPTLDQLQAAFLRNGGELPMLWSWRSEASQYEWLKGRAETWR